MVNGNIVLLNTIVYLSLCLSFIAVLVCILLLKRHQTIKEISDKVDKIIKSTASLHNFKNTLHEVEKRVKEMSKDMDNIRNEIALIKSDIKSIRVRLARIEEKSRITSVLAAEQQREVQREPVRVSPIPSEEVGKEEIMRVQLSSLSDLPKIFTGVKYACLFTSQGFSVEEVGTRDIEPAYVLEVVSTANKFTKGKDILIDLEKEILNIFYVDTVADLDVYACIIFKKPVSHREIACAKSAVKQYLNTVIKGG